MTFATEYFDIIIKVTTFSFFFYFIYLFFFLTTLKIYNSLLLLFCVSCVSGCMDLVWILLKRRYVWAFYTIDDIQYTYVYVLDVKKNVIFCE